MKAWKAIQSRLPRVAQEMMEARAAMIYRSLPRPGLLEDQTARFVGMTEWLMMIGAARNV